MLQIPLYFYQKKGNIFIMLTDITSREREVLNLLIEGVSPKEIANKLNISHSTVDFHRTKLYRKLGVHNIHELIAKSLNNKELLSLKTEDASLVSMVKNQPDHFKPTGEIIPMINMGFFASTDAEIGGNSTAEVYITREEIDGVMIDSVLNIKIKMALKGKDIEYAQAYTDKYDIIKRLRKANGVRFKALGDGKSWYVEFKTIESTPEVFYANYLNMFGTIRDKVIVVDVPYSSLYLPEWAEEKYRFEFNKESIKGFDIVSKNVSPDNAPSLLKIFDFEIY